jgi:ATP-dependent helicase/nuclease subunit B
MLRLLPPGADLLSAVLEELRGQGGDWRQNLVLFPGRRPAHMLRRRLALREGEVLFPPQIYAVQDWIETLVHEVLALPGRRADDLDALALLYAVHRDMPRRLRLGERHYESLDRFLPVGVRLLQELEELYLADFSPGRLRHVLTEAGLPDGEQVAAYFDRFYTALEREGLWTRARYVRAVADRIEALELPYARILVAGMYAFAAAEARLFGALLGRPNALGLFLQGPGLEEALARLNLPRDEISLDAAAEPFRETRFHFVRAPDRHGQVLALAEALRRAHEASGGPLDERTVVVLPASDALFPVLFWGLAALPEGEPYNISMGYPVVRTPVFGFLRLLLRALDTEVDGALSVSAYRAFLLHPYTKNLRYGDRTSEVTRMLVHAVEERLMGSEFRLRVRLQELERPGQWAEELARMLQAASLTITGGELVEHLRWLHDQTLRALAGARDLGDLARRARQLLLLVAEQSTASAHPYFEPFAGRLLEALEALARSRLARERAHRPAAYLRILEQYLGGVQVPFEGTPVAGLQILGMLETRGLRFRSVYVLDANESILPDEPPPAVFLSEGLRRRLGLERRRDRERLMRYWFETLLRGAEEVYLFYTEDLRTGKGERSRFVERLIWERENQTGRPEAEIQVRYRASLRNPRPEPVPKDPELAAWLRRRTYSARALDLYLRCPIRFYYQSVLGLEEEGLRTDELDGREVGSIVHEVLRRFFEPFLGHPLQADVLRGSIDRLRHEVRACFRERYGENPAPAVRLFRRQVERQLERFLFRYQIPLLEREPVRIIALEARLGVTWQGVRLEGIVDRIEVRGDRYVVLDYKTGSGQGDLYGIRPDSLRPEDRSSWGRAIGSVQLVLYRRLCAEAHGLRPDQVEVRYLFLGRNRLGAEIEDARMGSDVQASCAQVEAVLERLFEELFDPDMPFLPPDRLELACPGCPFQAICGTTWVRGWGS